MKNLPNIKDSCLDIYFQNRYIIVSQFYLWRNKVVKIRLKKFGAAKRPFYRIVVLDSRKPRDGRTLEEIGTYAPIAGEEAQISFDEERARYWIGVGAQPTETVLKLFNKKGFKR